MKQVIVFGASYCGPCQQLKGWLEGGGIDTTGATYTYTDIVDSPRALAAFRNVIGAQDFSMVLPGVAVMDNTVLKGRMDGYNQTWILNQLNSPSSSDSGSGASGANQNDETLIIAGEENFLGLDNEEWMLIGAIVFIVLVGYFLNRIKWI